MTDVYKIIDTLLKERGISGAKMSADLGMSRSFMTELRKGRAKGIKAETAQKIADYFGVSVDYLLGNVSDPFFHLDNERILSEINSYGDEKGNASIPKDERDFAKNDHEEEMLLLARHMDPIPEEDRQVLKEQFKNSIDLYLKAKGLSTPEDK